MELVGAAGMLARRVCWGTTSGDCINVKYNTLLPPVGQY